jgi:hypothetical protein
MLSVLGTCTKPGVPGFMVVCDPVTADGRVESPAVAAGKPAGVRPNVSVGNNGLALVLRGPAAALAMGTELVLKPEGLDVGTAGAAVGTAVGAVVGRGNCPQLVARVVPSRVEIGGALAPEVAAGPTVLVNGGTVNGCGPLVVGSVVPLVTPCAAELGLIGRPARSTFCASVCPASAKEGGTDGKLNPDPAVPVLSGLRSVITPE